MTEDYPVLRTKANVERANRAGVLYAEIKKNLDGFYTQNVVSMADTKEMEIIQNIDEELVQLLAAESR